MAGEGKVALRRLLVKALEDFAVWSGRERGPLATDVARYQVTPQFQRLVEAAYGGVFTAMERDRLLSQRGDPFRRLITHPLSDAFENGVLSRAILPNYFSFMHMVLGDDVKALSAEAAAIAAEVRGHEPSGLDWDEFYEDERAEAVLWVVLVRIAESFRRFDPRREWFIDLMSYKPQAVSVAPNAFVPVSANQEESSPFGVPEFNVLFSCLFKPLRFLSESERARFERAFGQGPEKAFGALWQNLEEGGADL